MHTIPYCYLLPVTEAACHASAVPPLCLRCAFAMPPLCLRYAFVPGPFQVRCKSVAGPFLRMG